MKYSEHEQMDRVLKRIFYGGVMFASITALLLLLHSESYIFLPEFPSNILTISDYELTRLARHLKCGVNQQSNNLQLKKQCSTIINEYAKREFK